MERDPHDVLGVVGSAEWGDIRTAYLTLARQYHPDGSTPDGGRMAEINAAYQALEHQRQRLNGSGVVLVRPPEGTLAAIAAAAPVLGARCATRGGVWSLRLASW